MSGKITTQEALIFLMVTMSAVDSMISDRELVRIRQLVNHLPVFEGYDPENLTNAAKTCGTILAENDNGLDMVLDIIAESVPKSHYDTAYALAVDVAASDMHVGQEELRLLERVRDRLDLDKLTVAAIERTARARYRILS